MTERRIQFNKIVNSQLPSYVKEEFPLISDFLSQYYISQEFKGASLDLVQNIDKYIKIDENSKKSKTLKLAQNISATDTTITVSFSADSLYGTKEFPDSYGLIKIGDEIITYTSKTNSSFVGCIRGFSGISEYSGEELIFSSTNASEHSQDDEIINLSDLFLSQFLEKVKYQFLPGFEQRNLYQDVNENIFIKQSKDFYSTRGTDESFKILFKALYGEDVKVVRPKEYLFRPSDAQFNKSKDLVVEPISGDPLNLTLSTLYQDQYGSINKAYGPVSKVEKLYSDSGNYYKLSLDSGYNRDLVDDGSVYGAFVVHPKTKCIGAVSAGSTILDVDSTVGFENSGELYVKYSNGSTGIVSYTSKSLNQFYGCSNITATINDRESIGINTYAYARSFENQNEIIKVRINSILNSFENLDDTYGLESEDLIQIRTLGVNPKDFKSNNWIINVPVSYQVQSITQTNTSPLVYRVVTNNSNILHVGDSIKFVSSTGDETTGVIISLNSEKSFDVSNISNLNLSSSYIIIRNLLKSLDGIISNVQNVYKKENDTLVASPSLPYFPETTLNTSNKTVSFSVANSYSGETIQITSGTDHGFYTGESVYYTPGSSTTSVDSGEGFDLTVTTVSSLFPNLPNEGRGLYYIKRVDQNNIKLSSSKSNLYSNIFLSASSDNSSAIHKLQKYEFYNKSIQNQKILREIKEPLDDGYQYETLPGKTGILVNGVEILNYKSKDSIYYGNLEKIDVLGGGSNYDIINPPRVEIIDNVGSGATGYCSIEGSLSSIQIIDSGFDYTDLPVITITGGNGSGAIAKPNMSLVDHNAYFNSNSDISLSTSVIGFTTYHRFRNNERVIYKTDNQVAVGGLSTDASYFVSTLSLYDVSLHRTYEDSVLGINTVTFTSLGEGRHYLSASNKKSIISSINIENPGAGYENKKRTVSSSGINTSSNTIYIKNHDFQSGETIKYSSTVTNIGGLSNNQNYIVFKVDDDRFKLSEVGIGQTEQNFFYQNKQYVNLLSSGSGTHIFNYPEILVNISGSTGIASTISSAVVQPIFRGSVTSIHLENGGVGYGSSEVLNFIRLPNISLSDGINAQATPIINNGSIVEVIIDNSGENYLAVPDLRIISDVGNGAVLTPIIENGQLVSVKVIQGGTGYVQGETILEFSNSGNGVEFDIYIKEWRVNLFKKEYSNIQSDDGFVSESTNQSYGLEYVNLYAPRKLRKLLNAINSEGDSVYGQSDLTIRNNIEIDSTNHSPLIGWAYDGNPIYGPYGYSRKSGGSEVVRMKSGYSLISNGIDPNRPPTSIYPNGFFVNDYEYVKSSDESVLDENNGRYCVTPDFPKGTYAYFATISQSIGSGIFLGFREPVFPYLIGDKFKSSPNQFNFSSSSNQDDFDPTLSNWFRNTTPYNLNGSIPYPYIESAKNLSQKSKISSTSSGSVDDIKIISKGTNYRVNDSIVFDEQNSKGFGANANVSFVGGKGVSSISVATTSISGIEIYPTLNVGEFVAISSNPHNFNNSDFVYISGLSTTPYIRTEYYRIGVSSDSFSLSREIPNVSSTGVITSVYLSGNLLSLKENDILGIGTENVKILNVYPNESRIRCIRSINGIGVSHSSTELVRNNPRNFNFNIGIRTSYPFKLNRQLYFDPQESVGLGTTSGVGISSTLFFDTVSNLSPIGIGTSTQSIIYFTNSRDYFRYNSGGYVDIVNATSIGFNTERRRIVSVGQTTVTIDFDTSSLSGSGVTAYLNRRNALDIPTRTIYIPNHTLETGDLVTYYSNSGNSLSISTTGVGSTTINDGTNLYVAKVSNDLIGLSTVRVGLGTEGEFVGITTATSTSGLLYFVGFGTDVYHSFSTNYDRVTGNASRNIVNVSTAQTHGLNVGDIVDVNVNPSISTTFTVKYNDYNRRLIINPKDFSPVGVNTLSDTISIPNHGFVTGQKVIHTSSSPSGGLQDNQIYYVVVVDENNLKLSANYFDTQTNIPQIIGITSSSLGTLSSINPPIKVYKNSNIIFDLSDSSLSFLNGSTLYSAFDFELFSDNNFTNPFNSTETTNNFEVVKQGRIGIDTNARITINVNNSFPNTLYYKLTPTGNSDNISAPEDKINIIIDDEVNSNNQLQVLFSVYNGRYPVVSSASTTSFSYQIANQPESLSYVSTSSSIRYKTSSLTAYGPIEDVVVNNSGSNYSTIPHITSINSGIGSGANLKAISNSIGKVRKVKIYDVGTDFPSDSSLRPSVILPQLIDVNSLSSIEFIGITSSGRGYTTAPSLLLFDGETGQLFTEVDLRYNIGDRNVTILRNTQSLSNTTPTILPIQNSNGVGISTVGFNTVTKDVTVTLSVGFSTIGSFPFFTNDRVLIENIGVSTGRGYNSRDYNYQLFTVTSVDANIGGYGTVTYNISDLLLDDETPGIFDPETSSGRIISERDFPIFNVSLTQGEFFEDEIITTSSNSGIVQRWDSRNNILKVSSRDYFEVGDIIVGSSSKTVGIASSIISFETFYNTSYFNIKEDGWSYDAGKLNDNLQVIQDGDYYQNFSYSLRSRIDLDTWNETVSTLNHTAGFKKFSDYVIESEFRNQGSVSESLLDVVNDVVSESSLHCYNDFDLVSENAIQYQSGYLSDEIRFRSRILQDYFESVGNRVLSIDNISDQFNSNPRPTNFSEVDRFILDSGRFSKYISYIRDRRYTSQRQLMLVTLIHSNGFGYINQYGRVETVYDLGSFDFSIDGSEGILLYYPTYSSINDYTITTLSYRLEDGISGIGTTTIGSVTLIETDSVSVSSGQTTIVGISTAHRSAKILVGINVDDSLYEFDEVSIIHDGTNVSIIEYGQLTSNSNTEESSISGYGTYYPYISGSQLNVDFIPTVGVGTTIKVNSLYIAFADEFTTGSGSTTLNHAKIISNTTAISSSPSPTPVGIVSFKSSQVDGTDIDITYQAAYHLVQVTDITNNQYQLSEVLTIDIDDTETLITEFGNIETSSGLGTIGAYVSGNHTYLTFTPLPNIDVDVKIYTNALRYDLSENEDEDIIDFENGSIESQHGTYSGTDSDIRRSFDLKHNGFNIFERTFDATDLSIVSISDNTFTIPNHFFVTGENVTYTNAGGASTTSIGIASTDFGVGIGTTDRLPSSVYIIKVNDSIIQLARSAEEALLSTPVPLDITSVGIGTNHSFTSKKQNSKVIIAIDNLIQSPIVSTALTTTLALQFGTSENIAYFSGITSFFGGDLVKIGDEIMKIESVGVGSTNSVRVRRPWLGTEVVGHSTGSLVTKVIGNYNIVNNTLNFVEAPYGNLPYSSVTNPPDERDWLGISTSSSFQGRTFLRSGAINSTNEPYYKNYIFDDISEQFDGENYEFTLNSSGSSVSGIENENAIILINDIFQSPGQSLNYTLNENSGITSISFVGTGISAAYDVNTSSLPRGGVIVSVGSTEGFGYQPLVSAGGTAIVSVAGTIQSISIGNSGSGYRSGSQVVRVGVGYTNTFSASLEFIGTATVSNGNIVSVAITNPGTGYTTSNPPFVVFDQPLSYSDIPLVYSSSSSGFGTSATIDIVVGQGSSIIDFEIKNSGYGYGQGEILTVPIGGLTGIPTTSGYSEFQISIQRTSRDKFTGWSLGEIQLIDSIESLFNSDRISFPIRVSGNLLSIRSSPGSNINIQDTLLIFVNDILQVPGVGYQFAGGSFITFTEAPKPGDTCKIFFYRGSGSIDVIERDILETVKVGDELTISYDPTIGQSSQLKEDVRTVSTVNSIDSVDTNPYFGPGNVSNPNLLRPVIWCKQTEDKIINQTEIGKDRILYEPNINPSAYLISSVGIGSTIIYVDSVRPFFDPYNESSASLAFQNNITIISQDEKVGAIATAVVSVAGTVSSIILSNGGSGYISSPNITLESPVGLGTTQRATSTSSISGGIVTSISINYGGIGYTSTNPPQVLIEPPISIFESDSVNSYEGDSGIIVGISTTSVGIASTAIVFDLFVPLNSYLRDSAVTGSAVTTMSGISTGDYFVIYESNVGYGATILSESGSVVGIATTYLDGVYKAVSVSVAQTSVSGVGITDIAKIVVSVSDYNGLDFTGIANTTFFGNYSWGKVNLSERTKSNLYEAYVSGGYSGITTGSLVKRTSKLKYSNYT